MSQTYQATHDLLQEEDMLNNFPIQPTANYKKATSCLNYSRQHKALYMLIGNNGFGKTSSIKHYAEKHPNIRYFRIGEKERPKAFFGRLIHQITSEKEMDLDLLLKNAYLDYLIDRVSYDIVDDTDIDLIVIDEFGNFTARFIPILRQLWDNISPRIGMVLAGPPSILNDMRKWQKEEKRGINEIFSRVGHRIQFLKKPSLKDVEIICLSRDITDKKLISRFFKNNLMKDFRVLQNMITDFKNGVFNP
ncbi:AAA family ATPase [Ekhidna sp.]|uniref:AAA family ATPase n=1 Tax=Ekhidna sp. TaxID=2608089 RepID=UPI003CCC11FE